MTTRWEQHQQTRQRHIALTTEVECLLSDRVICDRCGATLASFDNRCTEMLDVACPGFLLIEGAMVQAIIAIDHPHEQEGVNV